jgi:3-oxoacyl-[acyl-carrier protein] reductase
VSEFQDKVVLVTGAGRGVGRAAALAFAAQGAVVAVNDINPLSLDELVAQCASAGGRAQAYCFDVAKRMPVMALISQVMEECGRIDIVINNAAVEPVAALLDMDEWDWHRTIDVNLAGAFFVMQRAGRVMSDHGGGVIVNIGANRSHVQAQRSAYLASKEGLLSLTREAARELAAVQIRVHAVCPGQINAEVADSFHKQLGGVLADQKIPENVTDLVLFLCSQQAAHLTGIIIDCGSD